MTTLKRERNWKISVYGREYGVPRLHVTSPDFRATVQIATGEALASSLPASVQTDALQWLADNRDCAAEQWRAHNPTT